MQVLQQDGAEESEQLVKKQILLKTKIDQQQGQLNEIQTGLNSLSSNADKSFLTSNYSNLKVNIVIMSTNGIWTNYFLNH